MPPLQTDPTADVLVVCGPTASGKTSLAVQLADRFNGEVISADSRQVYRGLDIGSGKDIHEYTATGRPVPFHLIDIADPRDIYTLHHYQQDCYRTITGLREQSKLPVLCGGTGLFIEAVLRGYALPDVPEDRELRNRLMRNPKEELVTMLGDLDPEQLIRTDTSSKKRIVRAIEVATFRRGHPGTTGQLTIPSITPLILCTRFKRTDLHERITRRLNARLDEGMVDEVRSLRAAGVSDDRLLMLGMEYRHITRYLRGETDYCAMIRNLQHAIFQLAKRQETWFRGMERRAGRDALPWRFYWIDNADFDTAYAVARNVLNP